MKVVYLNFNPAASATEYWDHALWNDLIDGKVWTPPRFPNFTRSTRAEDAVGGAVLVIPARHNVSYLSAINQVLEGMPWALVVLTGDEGSTFPWKQLEHPNMRLWVMHLREDPADERVFPMPNGYGPECRQWLAKGYPERPLDWFFAGQVNHSRRAEMLQALPMGGKWKYHLLTTPGFLQGMSQAEYFGYMGHAKIAPCPSGPRTVDTFRTYEALEAGCIPIADAATPEGPMLDFWSMVLPGVDVPTIRDWKSFPGYCEDLLADYPKRATELSAQWGQFKRRMAYRLRDDLEALVG